MRFIPVDARTPMPTLLQIALIVIGFFRFQSFLKRIKIKLLLNHARSSRVFSLRRRFLVGDVGKMRLKSQSQPFKCKFQNERHYRSDWRKYENIYERIRFQWKRKQTFCLETDFHSALEVVILIICGQLINSHF